MCQHWLLPAWCELTHQAFRKVQRHGVPIPVQPLLCDGAHTTFSVTSQLPLLLKVHSNFIITGDYYGKAHKHGFCAWGVENSEISKTLLGTVDKERGLPFQ